MEAGGVTRGSIFLMVLLLLLPAAPIVKGEVEAPTLIRGTVTDSETGKPIPGVYVAVVNRTKDLHFYYVTDDDGSYSLNVGTGGVFKVGAFSTSHEELVKEVEIGLFNNVIVDLQLVRYEHNVRVHFYSWDIEYPLFALDVGITDSMGRETRYLTDPEGWLRLHLDNGNYTIRSYRDFLETYEEDFTISENRAFYAPVDLHPVNVNTSASLNVFHNNIYIPPKEFRAIVIEDEEPTAMWLRVNSDVMITIQQMTHEMYHSYLDSLAGIPFNSDKPPYIEFDKRIVMAYGGGGTVTVWQLPYYILLANNETESALVSVDIRYEYGSPIVSEVIGGPLEPGSPGPEPREFGISSVFVLIAAAILIALVLLIYRSHKRK
ncbi:MAG: carboxypeptidase regulatory-like domain-containing protein [Candidatus Thermoplasmatota archaeon]|nr:carboxypeptidase regulatory-like domain-containing protein [Candidatus Thermoplasmatota archaeon]